MSARNNDNEPTAFDGPAVNGSNTAPDVEMRDTAAIHMSSEEHHEAHPADQISPVNEEPHTGIESKAKSVEDDQESMESDYYYDDNGQMHTYYRPKKRLSTHSKGSKARANRQPPTGEGSHAASETASLGSTLRNPSLAELPANLRAIGKELHKLSTEELLYISAMVGRKAHRDAYSVLQYSGAAWYLPNIRKCHPEEKDWEIRYEWATGLILSLGGKRMEIQVLSYLLRASFLILFWFCTWNAIPKYLSEPGLKGYLFDPIVTFVVCALVGGFLCRILQIPPLVGCLWIGILWNNIPEAGYLTKGIYKDVRTISGRFGITVVLLRAGFSISWKTVRPILPNVGALVVLAYGVESMVHAFFADWLFDYKNYHYSFLEGCLCSAPSAAVVVPGSLMLQADGYSKTKGPLPLMLAAVAVETVLGVWVVNFILDLEFGSRSIGLSIALGPIQIIVGALLGVAFGFAFHVIVLLLRGEANRLPTGKYAETHLQNVHRNALIAFLLIAHGLIFYAYHENLAGGGAVAVMMFACTVSNFWTLSGDPEWMDMKKELGAGLCDVWDLFVMPFLFSMTGSKIIASKIFNSTFFPKALAVWAVSNAARMLAVSVTPFGLGFTWKELIFMMPGYCAKATVQSALASAALDKISKMTPPDALANPGAYETFMHKKSMAESISNVAIFYVMWSAPAAAVWVTKMGPRMLAKED